MTEWLDSGSQVWSACFDPTGQRIAVAGRGVSVWDLPSAPVPVPEWFPAFAEAVAGIQLDVRGNTQLVPRSEFEDLARKLVPKESGEFYERLAGWFLADPARRPVSPF